MISIPKGTKDMLPRDAAAWHYVEQKARETAALFSFREIRTPMFEHTELFTRGVGETTDIVTKEMYTFEDKGGRSMTLRPEGTAGVARAFIENGLGQDVMPMKAYYLASVFRYERPQSGRLREHHQFGVELYGSSSPYADAEVISLAHTFLSSVGIGGLTLHLNSIGCKECRPKFNAALRGYIGDNLDRMCGKCRERFDKNPLRILDCKEEKCREIVKAAPSITDFLCDDCRAHFEQLQSILERQGVPFVVDPSVVRGLDYYTRTVFEFVSEDIGAQGTVCGGGRYDGLVEEVGGKSTPAVGFGLGLERLLLVLQNTGRLDAPRERADVYLAPLGERAAGEVPAIAAGLRRAGVSADYDMMGRGVKAQMKYADKSGARFVVVIGDNELESGTAVLKNMDTGEERSVALGDIAGALK